MLSIVVINGSRGWQVVYRVAFQGIDLESPLPIIYPSRWISDGSTRLRAQTAAFSELSSFEGPDFEISGHNIESSKLKH